MVCCCRVGSSVLLSINRVGPAVRRGVGLRVWTARLRDSLASSANHLGLLRAAQSRLDATASDRQVPF